MNRQNLKPDSRGEYLLSLVGIKLQKDSKDSTGEKALSSIPSLVAQADQQFDEEAPSTSGLQASSAFVQYDLEDSFSSSSADFSSHDSQKDPDYCSSSHTSESDDGERSLDSPLKEMESPKEKKNTRKRKANPDKWKRNQAKKLRNTGMKYKSAKGKIVEERRMKKPCSENCKYKCILKFTDTERLEYFKKYWSLADVLKQRAFIRSRMQDIPSNSLAVAGIKKRINNHAFYFGEAEQRARVCKLFFTSSLGITYRSIRSVIEKSVSGEFGEMRGKHGKQKSIDESIKAKVREHINSIPKIESHYTRANTKKEYIEGGKTIIDLWRDYKGHCIENGDPFATLSMYRNIFNYEFNLAFFVPKKDQCQRCVGFENASEEEKLVLEADHLLHLEEKKLSRAEKERDKARVSESFKVACFDLQATLPTPKGEVSSFYYKSKLSTYNFTVCDLLQKSQGDVQCFMWHEGEGKRGAVEIGSCLLQYLQNKAALCSGELDIVFYSDNCGGQQKNKFVIAAYLYAIKNYKIRSITHKYLITGHTQNEGDNVHSLIEKNIKRSLKSGPIYTPDQYVTLVKTSKKTGHPFKVTEMSHTDFLDLKEMTDQTCVNFTKNTDGETFKFNDVAIFKTESQHPDHFFYKMSFNEEEYKMVNVKERRTRTSPLADLKDFEIKKVYTDSLPIPKKKYDDLMFLLRSNAIKSSYSYFYNSLKVAHEKQ